jgi:hypothetical protein|tara:strand:+ start:394 stop:717 length:324 start_codon:yes stop_codon:yes gene_type:complete
MLLKVCAEKQLELYKNQQGKIITVSFIKKDGSVRHLNGRFGVSKYLKTGDNYNWTYNYDRHYLTIFDMKKLSYRIINLKTVLTVQAQGNRYLIIDHIKDWLKFGQGV